MDLKEVEKLKEETKKLLEKFSQALSSVESDEENNVEREQDRRIEGQGKVCDETFRKIMLDNSPRHDDKFIIAEKKSW